MITAEYKTGTNGEAVKWGINNQAWYIVCENSGYYTLLHDGNVETCSYTDSVKELPQKWDDCLIALNLICYGDDNFSENEKASMMYQTVYYHGKAKRSYATLLTEQQIDSFLPKYSKIRGELWWVKKNGVSKPLEDRIVVTSDGFRAAQIDRINCYYLRPVIKVKKDVIKAKYPDLKLTQSMGSNKTTPFPNNDVKKPNIPVPSKDSSDFWGKVLPILIMLVIIILMLLAFLNDINSH